MIQKQLKNVILYTRNNCLHALLGHVQYEDGRLRSGDMRAHIRAGLTPRELAAEMPPKMLVGRQDCLFIKCG